MLARIFLSPEKTCDQCGGIENVHARCNGCDGIGYHDAAYRIVVVRPSYPLVLIDELVASA